jgi:LacI family transcriptional regulator
LKKPTIKDIARELDISVGTVHRALNNKGRIKAETKQKVLDKANELNYQANSVARKFALRYNYCILVVMPRDPAFYWDDIRKGVSAVNREISEFGAEIISYYIDDCFSPSIEKDIVRILKERRVDGLVIAPLFIHGYDQVIGTQKVTPSRSSFSTSGQITGKAPVLGPDDELSGIMAGELISKFVGGQERFCGSRGRSSFRFTPPLRRLLRFYETDMASVNLHRVLSYEIGSEYDTLRRTLSEHPDISASTSPTAPAWALSARL